MLHSAVPCIIVTKQLTAMEMTDEELAEEIGQCRNRLSELCQLADIGTTLSKKAPRISVGVSRAEYEETQDLARRCNTSISALGQLALRQLLITARNGAVPMLPPITLENSVEYDRLGRPLV